MLVKVDILRMHPERAGRAAPASIRHEGKHGVSARSNHDELAWFDFQMALNFHVAQNIYPGTKDAWNKRHRPAFQKIHHRLPKNRREVRVYMKMDPVWQMWSSLKRNNQEMSYQMRAQVISRQEETIRIAASKKSKYSGSLKLNPLIRVPRYLTAVDIHCMPGGYNADDGTGIYAGANYDIASLYLATGGELGIWNDGAGWANVAFIHNHFPTFVPKTILDLGCTVGHSTLPLKKAWPDAKVHAIDVCAPLLRYASARADSLSTPIHFSQQNADALDFDEQSFDLVVSTMFLHEVPQAEMKKVAQEIYRLLKPQGLMLHNEQPQYHGQSPEEQFLREWDTWYNNEPMRCGFRDMNLSDWAEQAGFSKTKLITKMAPGAMLTKAGLKIRNDGLWLMIACQK